MNKAEQLIDSDLFPSDSQDAPFDSKMASEKKSPKPFRIQTGRHARSISFSGRTVPATPVKKREVSTGFMDRLRSVQKKAAMKGCGCTE